LTDFEAAARAQGRAANQPVHPAHTPKNNEHHENMKPNWAVLRSKSLRLQIGFPLVKAAPDHRAAPKRQDQRSETMLRFLPFVLCLLSTVASAAPVALTARDGVQVFADYQTPQGPLRATILLFHMADSNKAEYADIAARLTRAGFATLAIDQRSGGTRFGAKNATVAALGGSKDFVDALPDLEAALQFGADHAQAKPIAILGSSYSAALVFVLAQKHPAEIAAVMAFSPGEYLGSVSVAGAAASLTMPIFVTSADDKGEVSAAKAILHASPSKSKVQFVPKSGIHGASTLNPDLNGAGFKANWAALDAFLARFN
jgi:pimeloyl-ACP methyl ester carboxylesterase